MSLLRKKERIPEQSASTFILQSHQLPDDLRDIMVREGLLQDNTPTTRTHPQISCAGCYFSTQCSGSCP
ncbi:hypothetical protein [Timonella sp. A28]|uniref:hypothetical protein n=1 Tax=Timonella sp. A28 TaxID=3442640 RepID=UPI003EB9A66B